MESYENNLYYDSEKEKIKNTKEIIVKLKSILKLIGEKDPYKLENNFYKKYGCESEKDKLILTCNYINHFLMNYEAKDESVRNRINEHLNTIKQCLFLLESGHEIPNEVIKLMKIGVLKIALTYDLKVLFYSEVENLYNALIEQYNDKTRGLTR